MVEAILVITKVSEAMLATNSGFTKLIMEVVQMYLQCIVQCTTEIDLTNYTMMETHHMLKFHHMMKIHHVMSFRQI